MSAVYWLCTSRPHGAACNATAIQHGDDDFQRGNNRHNHSANSDADTLASIHARIDSVAKNDVFVPAAGIVQDALTSELNPSQPLQAMPQFASLVKSSVTVKLMLNRPKLTHTAERNEVLQQCLALHTLDKPITYASFTLTDTSTTTLYDMRFSRFTTHAAASHTNGYVFAYSRSNNHLRGCDALHSASVQCGASSLQSLQATTNFGLYCVEL